MIQSVNKGLSQLENDCPPLLQKIKLNKEEKETLGRLQNFIRHKSDIYGIDPALVGKKSELQELVQHPFLSSSQIKQRKGWRQRFLAEFNLS